MLQSFFWLSVDQLWIVYIKVFYKKKLLVKRDGLVSIFNLREYGQLINPYLPTNDRTSDSRVKFAKKKMLY